jgi:RNA polymerase sigma factor (sigma-70 family)
MFQTTIWTTIRDAGARDPAALERLAVRYRPAILRFVRGRGFAPDDAEDVCQDVFVRLLSGGVLERVDAQKGKFRSLLLAVTTHVIADRRRRRRESEPLVDEPPAPEREPEFDRAWALHLAETAMAQLREMGSPYFDALRDHLDGKAVDRNKIWIARGKLVSLIRREIAFTCASHEEFLEEAGYLSAFLRPNSPDSSRHETASDDSARE